MIASQLIERRNFLKTASTAAGLMTIVGGLGGAENLGADIGSAIAQKQNEAAEKTLVELEAQAAKYLNMPRKDGAFLSLMIKATRAKNVLEVGTAHGYGTIWISQGLGETDGKLTTIEILSERVELAKKHVSQAGLNHRVTFNEGNAHEIVPTLIGPFDFVLLNADKDGQLDYFRKLYPTKLAPGGIIAVHKAISRKEPMKEFLEMINKHPDFDSVVLSLTMEDGFSVSHRKRK